MVAARPSSKVAMAQKSVEPTQEQRDRREALLKEYSEISNTFRALTDIRFRLLIELAWVKLN
jgi:hypothetical protein